MPISCGIDNGKILLIGHEDCFGDAVNRASKIGEDLAAAGEILITKEAMDIIPTASRIKAQEMKVSISGVLILPIGSNMGIKKNPAFNRLDVSLSMHSL